MKINVVTKCFRKVLPLRCCGAVIVAAGSASRMGGIDKVMAPLAGEPMIVRTARAFQECDAISEIVIVTSRTFDAFTITAPIYIIGKWK